MTSLSSSTKFTRILFESDELEALQTLSESLSTGQFEQTVEWLTAWQDLINPKGSPLTPLLDSLQEEDREVALLSLRVLNGLLTNAPDSSRRFRIQNELKELNFNQLLGQTSLRWETDKEIQKEIQIWFSGGTESENQSSEMTDVEPVLSDLRGLLADDSAKEERIRVVLGLLDTLKNVKNPEDAEQTLSKLTTTSDKNQRMAPVCAPPRAPPPPPPPRLLAPPMPPPPPPPPQFGGKGPPPPPPFLGGPTKAVSAELPSCMKPKKVPDKDVKMKTLMWSKLPPSALTNEGKESVWGQLASAEPRGFSFDFEVIEGMFSLNSVPVSTGDLSSASSSFKKKDNFVDLLTPKRSQNVTITLKRFKNLDLVLNNIRENKTEEFELEMLRTLKGILPDEEEVGALRRYSGDIALLAPACSFFLSILSISDYRLRIDCMSFRLEFRSTMDEVFPQLNTVNQASLEILNSGALKRLLLLLVNIGNFLNGSTAHGNAAGFKLNSLWKMIDMKAAKGGASLLHALAKMDENLLKDLEEELPTVKAASEVSIEETRSSLRQLADQANKLERMIAEKTEICFVLMREYLQEKAGKELAEGQELLTALSQRQNQLAAYFCENKNSFKAEECFKIFSNFMLRLRIAVQDNKERAEKTSKKLARQSASDENVPGGEKETLSEEKLFATLEKGSVSLKASRRRSSMKTNFEFSRERDSEVENRLKQQKEDRMEEKKESPLETPRIIRRTRRSIHIESAPTLNDLMERLQASTLVKPPTVAPIVPEENISVIIPSESDGCVSTPGTSPKSSDEGFESEKDKEMKIIPQSTINTMRRTIPTAKTPRLVSITTTGNPPSKAAQSRPSQLAKPRVIPTKTIPVKPPLKKEPEKSQAHLRPSAPSSIPSTQKKVTPIASKLIQPVKTTPRRTLPAIIPLVSKPPIRPIAAPRKSLPARMTPLEKDSSADSKPPPVSTSARPSLIKTGSLSQRPNLKGLEVVEKPRPLKKIPTLTTLTAKPKWV